MGIVLARVDDRLIHGQVMTSWLNYTGANKIVVIDDTTANDPFMSMVIKTLVPANIKTEVCTVENSVSVINGLNEEEKVIILAKNPSPFVHLVNNNIKLSKINVGGMGSNPDRSKLYRNIFASEKERSEFKELMEKGLTVEIQMVAEDPKTDVNKYI